MSLRFLTAGESHGPALTVIVEGLPAGVTIDVARVDRELKRRMGGYGRGGRMKIERDRAEWLSGVRFGNSLGSPIAIQITNLDHKSWLDAMPTHGEAPTDSSARRVTRPRPGHADLAGALKYGTHDARDVFERSSARETAARTAAGAIAKELLHALGVEVTSYTAAVGEAHAAPIDDAQFEELVALADDVPMRVLDEETSARMIAAVDAARKRRDSIGGVFEVLARGLPVGLGSHAHWDRRLDGRIAGALMSIQAVKAVSVGEGIEGAEMYGSDLHDAIEYDASRGFVRPTNRAGGVEGGMSNGEMLRAKGWLKPLATLPKPLGSIDLITKEPFEAIKERTDTIPIVAAGVVGEAMVAWILAEEMLIKFGGDRLSETQRNLEGYLESLRRY
jgi:chorismate synthase